MWQRSFKTEVKVAFTSEEHSSELDAQEVPYQPYASRIKQLPSYALKRRKEKLEKQIAYVKAHRKDYTPQDINDLFSKLSPIEDEIAHRKLAESNKDAVKKTLKEDLWRGILFGAGGGLASTAVTTPEEVRYLRKEIGKNVGYWPTFKSKATKSMLGYGASFGAYRLLNELYDNWYLPKKKNVKHS